MTDECPTVGPKHPTYSHWSWQMLPGYDNKCYFDYSSGKKLRYNTKMIGYLNQDMYNNYNPEDIVVAKLGNGKPQYHGVYSSSSSWSGKETKEAREKRLAEEKRKKEEYMDNETKILPAFTKDIYKFTPDKGDEKPKEEEKETKGTMGLLQYFKVPRDYWGNFVKEKYPIKNSRLVGVRGDGIGSTLGSYADYTQPVFWTDSIYGQKGGSFWAMEDDITKLIAGARPWINVTPILNKDGNPHIGDEKGRPKKEEIDNYLEYSVPCKDESETYKRQKDGNNFCGAYLFKWAPNVGDSAYRTATQYGFISDETNNKKKGGKKRTNKRKMNKRKKTRRNNKNKRKTVKK